MATRPRRPTRAPLTWGLTHIALGVRDPARAARFYQDVLGARVVWQSDDFVQLQTPGSRDVIVLERSAKAGQVGGLAHFGFRLKRPGDIGRAAELVRRAGGTVTGEGEFVPGEPYLFARDLDGYVFEIWFELPTVVDPKPARRRRAGTSRKEAGR